MVVLSFTGTLVLLMILNHSAGFDATVMAVVDGMLGVLFIAAVVIYFVRTRNQFALVANKNGLFIYEVGMIGWGSLSGFHLGSRWDDSIPRGVDRPVEVKELVIGFKNGRVCKINLNNPFVNKTELVDRLNRFIGHYGNS